MSKVYFNQLGYKVSWDSHYPYIVEDFQRRVGLDIDGIIGPKTRAAMARYNKNNFIPEIFEPIKPYVEYTDEQIESLCSRGLVGLGSAFNYHSRLNDFDVIHNLGHAILESGYGESPIAQAKNNIYGWTAYDHDPSGSATAFTSMAECIEYWSREFNQKYLLPDGEHFRGNSEFAVNVVYATSGTAGMKKAGIVQDLRKKLQDPGAMTEEEYERIGKDYQLTRNFVLGEFYSSQVINGVKTTRAVKPPYIYFEEILLTAQEAQKIRDMLNEVYGHDLSVGIRNSAGEIIVIVGSGWRTNAFQYWLWSNGKSTTNDSKHEYGLAIDINRIPGLGVSELLNFIKTRCATSFTWFKEYDWGLHLDRRQL